MRPINKEKDKQLSHQYAEHVKRFHLILQLSFYSQYLGRSKQKRNFSEVRSKLLKRYKNLKIMSH